MPIFKVNFFFTQRTYGWTETYFCDRVDALAAMTSTIPLVPLRVAMLGGLGTGLSDPRFREIRISDIDFVGDSDSYTVPDSSQFNSHVLGVADNPNLALLSRMQATTKYRRAWMIRGFPDKMIDANGIYIANPQWNPSFNAFGDALKARSFGMEVVDKDAAVFNITGLNNPDPLTPKKLVVTTSAPHGMNAGDRFRILSAPGSPQARGTWTVFEPTSPTSISFFIAVPYTGFYTGGGRLRKRLVKFVPFTTIQIERATKRGTGGPFDRPVGRRKRRVKV